MTFGIHSFRQRTMPALTAGLLGTAASGSAVDLDAKLIPGGWAKELAGTLKEEAQRLLGQENVAPYYPVQLTLNCGSEAFDITSETEEVSQ